jgi:hypothetical protein
MGIDALAVLRKTRAQRLRLRERLEGLRERAWAFRELARMELRIAGKR